MPQRPPFKADVLAAIARAILAERKRCVGIASAHLKDTSLLLTSPAQSGAAWEIRNDIERGIAA